MKRFICLLALLLPGISWAQTGGPPPYAVQPPVTNGQCLVWSSAKNAYVNNTCGSGASGTVTSVSIATANGFSGTVANPTTTPALTINTLAASSLGAGALPSGVTSTDGNPLAGTTNTPVLGENAIFSSSSDITGEGATLYADQFPGADESIQIGNCLVALYAYSTQNGTCIANSAGPQTWSVNPFGYAGTEGTTYPVAGTLIVCGPGTIQLDGTVVIGNRWRMISCAGSVAGGAPTFVANTGGSPAFQATYTTGTITPGAIGQGDVITGVGTTWNSNMRGCAFVAPATQPTGATRTFGIISAVSSATSLTLGFGQHGNSGDAPGGSTYAIYCPMFALGDGNVASAFEYIKELAGFKIDCNNVAGCIGVLNWFSEEGTIVHDNLIQNFTNIGLDVETNYSQNSGPYYLNNLYPGSGCSALTISIELRGGGIGERDFWGNSLNNPFCSTNPNVAFDVGAYGPNIHDTHIERNVIGIDLGDTNSCAVACAMPPQAVRAEFINGINTAPGVTTLVAISNAVGAAFGIQVNNLTVNAGNTVTNILTDLQNSCSDTNQFLGHYLLADTSGNVQESSAIGIIGCQATPLFGTTVIQPSGTATSGSGNFDSYFLQWRSSYWNGSAAATDQINAKIVTNTGTTPSSFMAFTHSGSTGWKGYKFDGVLAQTTLYSAAGTALPTCNGNPIPYGSMANVSDATTYNGAYISGGALTGKVLCASTNAWIMIGGGTLTSLSIPTGTATFAVGSGVTSVVCASGYTCNNTRGTLTIVGGTATTGTIATVSFSATLSAAPACFASMNGGATLFSIGNGAPSTTSFTITAGISVIGATFNVNYWCQP